MNDANTSVPVPSDRAAAARALALVAVLLLTACASARTEDPELRRRAAAVPVLASDELGNREYEIVAEVEGRSCATDEGEAPSMEGARSAMRIDAAEKAADGIINAFCEEVGVSLLVPQCTSRIECRGDAIRWSGSGHADDLEETESGDV